MATVATASEASRVTTQEAYLAHLKKLKSEIEKRNNKSVEQLFAEKQKRLWDAIEMKEPDRVPVILGGNYFAAKYCGLPYSSVYYDPIGWKAAYTRMVADFEPDNCTSGGAQSGAVLDLLQAKNALWPGGPLPPDRPNQTVEGEYMKEDEYDLFLDDTTDFIVRRYLPRVYGALAPLAKLPGMSGGAGGIQAVAAFFNNPEFEAVGRILKQVAQEQAKHRQLMGNFNHDLVSLGFPPMSEGGEGGPGGGVGGPAFDHIANTYRGWKGIATDMYRRPDKLIAAMEKVNRQQLTRGVPADRTKKGPQVMGSGPIHRGSDRFMSKKQWETFYWPTWKKCLQRIIDLGYKVSIFTEGFVENRFEYFMEFPKGSLVLRFTDTDIFKAKAALGDRFPIIGGIPSTLLQMGSPADVDELCKKLIQVCGKDGGFILRTDTDYIQEAKPENVKAMVDSVKKYRP